MGKRKPSEPSKGCPYGDPTCKNEDWNGDHDNCTPRGTSNPDGDDAGDGEAAAESPDHGVGQVRKEQQDAIDEAEVAEPAPPLAGPTEGMRPGEAAKPPLKFISVPNVDGIRLESSGQRIALVFESRGAELHSPDVEIIVQLAGKHLDALAGLLKNADFKSKEAVVYSARFPRPENTQLEMAL